MKLKEWINNWAEQYDARELEYMEVHKALIQIQLKDKETGRIILRNSTYTAKNREDLLLVKGL